jgi:hypothetical protein
MSDTGPVCSCGTASAANPCPKHPDVDQEALYHPPNRRIELKLETVLNAVGYHTVRFDGIVAICDQPARLVNTVNLLGQLLVQADDLIEAMRPYLPENLADQENVSPERQERLRLIWHDLMQWGNPPKIEMPEKKGRKKKP